MAVQPYKKPVEGRSLTQALISDWKTPIAQVVFSNLLNPFFYPGSPTIPRYSITLRIDPKEHSDFMDEMIKMEATQKVESQFRHEFVKGKDDGTGPITTGKSLLKFPAKEDLPVFKIEEGKLVPYKLKYELPKNALVQVVFDLQRYTIKSTGKQGITSRATKVIVHELPKHSSQSNSSTDDEPAPF